MRFHGLVGSISPLPCPYSIDTWFLMSRCNDNDHSSSLLSVNRALTRHVGLGPVPCLANCSHVFDRHLRLAVKSKLRVFDRHLCLAVGVQPSEIPFLRT